MCSALALAAVLYLVSTRGNDQPQMIIGQEPLANLPVEKIQSIKITSVNETSAILETLTLTRGENAWIVGNGRDYPADADRIERFVKEFKNIYVCIVILLCTRKTRGDTAELAQDLCWSAGSSWWSIRI
mgnify:CR=1 FL=1